MAQEKSKNANGPETGNQLPQSKSDVVNAVVEHLMQLQQRMDSIIELKKSYQSMIFEPRLLFAYRRGCIAFLMALQLYKSVIVS